MSMQLFRVGRIWHYRFQIDGVRVRRSTRESARHRAEATAEAAYRQALLWSRKGKEFPSLLDLAEHWIETNRPVMSDGHVRIVDQFRRLYLYDLGQVPIDRITTDLVEATRNRHLVKHAASTANQWLRVLKLLLNSAVRRGLIPALPFKVGMIKVQKKPRAILPAKMARAWLEAIDEQQSASGGIATAVRLMIGMGLREAETITARWEWIDWARQTYTPGATKGREADPIPMPVWLQDHLRPIRLTTGLIVTKPDGKPFARGYTRSAMLRANRKCGTGHVTAHRLRGTFATLMSEMGAPIQSIQRAMRHKSPLTTMAYLESNLDYIAIAQRRMATEFGFDDIAIADAKQTAKHMPQTHAT